MKQSTFFYLLRRGAFGGGGGDSFTGLLDTYSGAAAAYSLRQLSSTYEGDAIVVRRASDNTTQSIGFVDNELDTTSLESFCSGTDGFVTTWYDQSGNGNNATQGSAAAQPQIVSSGSTILSNAKPSLQFDGSADFMTTPSVALSTNNIALFNVFKLNSSTFATWFSYGGYVSNGFLIQRPNNSFVRYAVSGTSYQDFNDTSSLPSTTNQILLSLIDYDSNSSVYIDNVSQGTKSISVSLNSSNTIELGRRADNATQYTPMNAQEFVFYPIDQSSNRTGIETNINDFYTIY